MIKRLATVIVCGLLLAAAASAQYTPWLYWTFLPRAQMDEIVGEASGETAWNTIAEINAFNRERFGEEFAGNFLETQVVVRKLKSYGLDRRRHRDLSRRPGLGGRQGRALGDQARPAEAGLDPRHAAHAGVRQRDRRRHGRARLGRPRHAQGDHRRQGRRARSS